MASRLHFRSPFDSEVRSAMDEQQATAILKSLATGSHPFADGPLEDCSVLQVPDVVRALHLGADALANRGRLAKRQAQLPRNAGKTWTAEEDDRLLAAFDGGTPVAALATAHERTRAGIEARLVKHARLDPEQAPAARIR